jgi:hypothetical protein
MDLKVRSVVSCTKDGDLSYKPRTEEIVIESHPDFEPNNELVLVEIDGDRYVVDGKVLIAAVTNAMNLGRT